MNTNGVGLDTESSITESLRDKMTPITQKL